MTNPAPEELIPFLAHEERPVRSYTARLLGLDNEGLRARAILNSAEAHHTIPARPVGTIRSRGRVVRTTDFKAFGVTVHTRVQ